MGTLVNLHFNKHNKEKYRKHHYVVWMCHTTNMFDWHNNGVGDWIISKSDSLGLAVKGQISISGARCQCSGSGLVTNGSGRCLVTERSKLIRIPHRQGNISFHSGSNFMYPGHKGSHDGSARSSVGCVSDMVMQFRVFCGKISYNLHGVLFSSFVPVKHILPFKDGLGCLVFWVYVWAFS